MNMQIYPFMTNEWPIRIKSVRTVSKSQFFRKCETCDADFIDLAAMKTGERGLWFEWKWYCSLQCTPKELQERLKL